ncbi:MAG: ATP-grasp domain-containing protein [Fidelibacterota bacterium]
MIIIDKPYISDFLLNTIKDNNFPIIETQTARKMIGAADLNWISEADARATFQNKPFTKLYTNSENAIAWIERNLTSTDIPRQCDIFKNKIKFRELIQYHYPDYYFRGIKYADLKSVNPKTLPFPLVVKPAVGFFSIAVNKVDTIDEWPETLHKIEKDLQAMGHLYPEEVVNVDDFIIEAIIDGEEYAVDCYFDESGEPVVLNILHHIFSSGKDVSDRIYSTSQEIVERHYSVIQDFLKMISRKTKLKNFPAHVEVRIDDNGRINPIEVNPMRFGGWCTTADLTGFGYCFNSYQYFIEGKKPNWTEIFKTRKGKKYSIVILDNNSGIHHRDIEYFDYDLLLQDFEKALDLRKVDYTRQPFFGILFVETDKISESELNHILKSDLKKYIKAKK